MTFSDLRGVAWPEAGRLFSRSHFCPGCFRRDLHRQIFLSINHDASYGDPTGRTINEAFTLASTTRGTLLLHEDARGLVFAACVATAAAVHRGDDPPLVVTDALAHGQCLGVSIVPMGGGMSERIAGPTIPADCLTYHRVVLAEISLLFAPSPAASCPGTWAMLAGPAALARLADEQCGAAIGSVQ